jgi:type IV pilus secretin PilQ/predicted competence protein
MVKVASMRRAKRILLISGVLLLSVSAADARLWGSRKAQAGAETAPVASAVTLSAVEVDGSRILLRTSGAPAYTSYSPSPGVFVVDLTGTSRDAGVVIPESLPASIASIAAEEVVEMGSALTRVTFRLTGSQQPEVSAIEKSVVVTIPGAPVAATIPQTTETVEPVATETVVASAVTGIEAMPEPAAPQVETAEPVEEVVEQTPRVDEAPLPRARSVKAIGASTTGDRVEVKIAADGQLRYKAFRLESPSRLVVDLDGVRNAAARSTVTVDDDVVKRVRVAQFQPNVARVVVDLAQKTEYDIREEGGELFISFGGSAPVHETRVTESAPVVSTPAPVQVAPVHVAAVEPPAPKVESSPAPASYVANDIPAQVAVVATDAPAWNVPPPASAGARAVIRQAEPTPAPRPVQEDVFDEPATRTQAATSTLSGSRTLSAGPRVFNGEPISLNLKDADIKDVLRTFAELTGLNIAVDPGVTGSVTVDFVDVPWDQALDLILRQNGLTWTIEGNVMRIGTIERMAAEATASRRLDEEERLKVPLTTISFKLSYARAIEVSALLRDIASPRARIITDARTNQIIVSEIPDFLRTMQNLITTVDIPSRQVMIEARIVESSRTFSQSWGFEWGFGGDIDPSLGTGSGLLFPNRIGYDAGPFELGGGGPTVLSLSFFDVLGTFNLDLALHAAEAQGFAKIVSAPRVTTQDNQAAEIQSGFQIPYQTRINFTTTVTYLDATLRLSVTPQITEAGTVIMDIAVQKNEPVSGLAIEGAAGTPLTTRQARTRLMVRDGGTAVIAGIFQARDNNRESRVPFVHNIPVIGQLFKSHGVESSQDELLIFITPRIVRG